MALGVPIYLTRGIYKLAVLKGTEFERQPIDVAFNFVRAFAACINSWSLFMQWRATGTRHRRLTVDLNDLHQERDTKAQASTLP